MRGLLIGFRVKKGIILRSGPEREINVQFMLLDSVNGNPRMLALALNRGSFM